MRRLLKVLIRIIFLVVPLALLAAGGGVLWLSRSLPEASGTETIAGLSGPVTITRDGQGVPHIEGATRADVFAGLGFAHAQDRLWQMEVARMAGQGRLSELFGKATVGTDIWLRTMGLYEAAKASLSTMSPEVRAALDAYARGVNAWIDRPGRTFAAKLPPEFVILGVTPEPWTAADTVVSIKMMSVGLAENLGAEIERLSFARLGLSPAEIDDLLPPLDVDTPPTLPDLKALLSLDGGALEATHTTMADGAFAPIDAFAGTGASNNWVISGARTASGKPILANDPHLGLTAPSIWYLAHLKVTKEFGTPRDLVGATLAGTPYVFLGRSDAIAWGFTNTGADVQDIFVEKVDPDDPERYRTPDGWAPFETKRETIRVAGEKDVTFERRATRHGPVLPAAYGGLDRYLPAGDVAALQWVALARDDTTAVVGYDLWDARTVADFQNLMRNYVTPMQSMVVADTEGNIGLIAAGRVPVRDPGNKVMGRAPVPGWDPLYDWKGTIPFADLPREKNPAEGAIGTANAKIVGPDYKPFLTFDWEEPYRQDRIRKTLIEAPGEQTPAISKAAQADVFDPGLAAILPMMMSAVAGRDDVDMAALDLLKTWDGRMDRDQTAPLIVMAWVREAMKDIYADDLGPSFDRWFKVRPRSLERALAGKGARNWCDDRRTDGVEECPAELAKALSQALADLENRYGPDRKAWTWGAAHMARGEHRPFGQVPPLDRLFNVEVESPGGPFTLNRGVTDLDNAADPFGNTHASSYRGIFDLSDLDASTYIQTTGQSGNVFSRHYRDFAARWADVEAITIPTAPEAYRGAAEGVWTLDPGP